MGRQQRGHSRQNGFNQRHLRQIPPARTGSEAPGSFRRNDQSDGQRRSSIFRHLLPDGNGRHAVGIVVVLLAADQAVGMGIRSWIGVLMFADASQLDRYQKTVRISSRSDGA